MLLDEVKSWNAQYSQMYTNYGWEKYIQEKAI
jgi:hypothetical protein